MKILVIKHNNIPFVGTDAASLVCTGLYHHIVLLKD